MNSLQLADFSFSLHRKPPRLPGRFLLGSLILHAALLLLIRPLDEKPLKEPALLSVALIEPAASLAMAPVRPVSQAGPLGRAPTVLRHSKAQAPTGGISTPAPSAWARPTEEIRPLPGQDALALATETHPVSGPVDVSPQRPSEAPALTESPALSKTVWQLMNAQKRYPRRAQQLGQEGVVEIEAVINAQGQLLEARIHQSSGFKLLDQDALALLRSVTPLPRELGALAPATRVRIPMRYVLE
jgi:protein TonB